MAIFKSRKESVEQPTEGKTHMDYSEDMEATGSQHKSDTGRIERVELTPEEVSTMFAHTYVGNRTDSLWQDRMLCRKTDKVMLTILVWVYFLQVCLHNSLQDHLVC